MVKHELLEIIAKYGPFNLRRLNSGIGWIDRDTNKFWDAWEDDGDALRLAYHYELEINCLPIKVRISDHGETLPGCDGFNTMQVRETRPYPSGRQDVSLLRHAIVAAVANYLKANYV